MEVFFNPETKDRIKEAILRGTHGLTPETAHKKGYYPLDILPLKYDTSIYNLVEKEVVLDTNTNRYKVVWELVPLPMFEIRKNLKALTAAIRYKHEIDGVIYNGSIIHTDRESQSSLASSKILSDLIPDALIDWKSSNGWITVNRDTIITIGKVLGTYVQQCFSYERHISDMLDAAEDIEDIKIILPQIRTGWPESAGLVTRPRRDSTSILGI